MEKEEKCFCTEVKQDIIEVKQDIIEVRQDIIEVRQDTKKIKDALLGKIGNDAQKPGLISLISTIKAQQILMWGILIIILVYNVVSGVFGGQ